MSKTWRMKKLVLILFIFCTTAAGAQYNIDSLKNILNKEKTDSATLHKYLNQMELMQTTEQEPYMVTGNWVLTNAVKLNILQKHNPLLN